MPAPKPRLHLIAYDIADPRRLTRVHRALTRVGIPLQYSVFLVPITATALDTLLAELAKLICPAEDDIRAYAMPARLHLDRLGRQHYPDGLQLLGDGPLNRNLGAFLNPVPTVG